jgi:hypothetical protein
MGMLLFMCEIDLSPYDSPVSESPKNSQKILVIKTSSVLFDIED